MICLVGVALLTLGAGPNGDETIAILPVAAEKVTLEAVPQLERLDDALRKGARNIPGIKVQDEARTTANLQSVREMDIKCDVEDTSCLSKIAVLTEVGRLVVPIARLDGTTYSIRMLIVNTSGGAKRVEKELPADATDDALESATRTLVEELLRALPPNAPAEKEPPPPPPPNEIKDPPPPPVEKTPLPPMFVAGVGTAAAGGLLFLGGATGALLVDNQLGTPPYPAFSEREKLQTLGKVLIGSAAVGVIAAGIGGTLIVMGAP
jgi:hypothetical protein